MVGRTNVLNTPYGAGDASSNMAIMVSAPKGYTCRCTNGTTTLRANNDSGKCIFYVPEAGEWYVTTEEEDAIDQHVIIDGAGVKKIELKPSLTRQYLKDTIKHYKSNTDTVLREHAFACSKALETVETSATTINSYAFYTCPNLVTIDLTSETAPTFTIAFSGSAVKDLIIRSNTLVPIASTSYINGLRACAHEGGIYVPASLLSAYKSASNWSTYADNIYPIESYPVTEYSTITDSWETIFANEVNGTYSTKYSVGDVKGFEYDGNMFYAIIVGIDADDLADNTGKAPITWIINRAIENRRINNTRSTTGGWAECEMRNYLRTTVFNKLPQIIQTNIKTVTKTYWLHESLTTSSISDTLWIPSIRELGGTSSSIGSWYPYVEESGVVYSYFNSNTRRFRYGSTYASIAYWTRFPCGPEKNVYCSGGGFVNNSNVDSSSYALIFGFCT